jgi:hypothetical protein
MFGQFLPNKNDMLQCSTVLHSDSAAANSGQLNTPKDMMDALVALTNSFQLMHDAKVARIYSEPVPW